MKSMERGFMLAVGAGLGVAGMYLFDPDQGARRRALARDKTVHGLKLAGRWSLRHTKDLANRGFGQMAELRAGWRERSENITDAALADRVRSHLGHVVAHPGSLEVRAQQGVVTVSGPVLKHEPDRIAERLRKIHGIKNFELYVEPPTGSENVQELRPRTA